MALAGALLMGGATALFTKGGGGGTSCAPHARTMGAAARSSGGRDRPPALACPPVRRSASCTAHVLNLSGISKRYGPQVVLEDVTWGVPDGARVGLTGPNGAGKSTLLRVLGGLERPTVGTLAFRGAPIEWGSGLLPFRRRIATLFAESHLADTTVAANVALGCRLRRLPAGEIRRRSRR